MSAFEIRHLGGEHGVTGSCHLLMANGVNILVDCGLAQGRDTVLPMTAWPVKPSQVDFLFLTHAHIDHIGRVPELLQKGFSGEIITTHPTRELLAPMLSDAAGFSGMDEGESEKLLHSIDRLCWGFEYGKAFDLKRGVRFKLGCTGHILGSCFIRFESSSPDWSVIFSGDLGAKDTPILPDPDPPDACDLLVLE
ncbi:MAG: MBL fold metallo-hydrolase, partial [Desulfoferrobacter sp.]